MKEMMTFPDTWEEFEKSYGFTDSEEAYTNGARLIPSFRVKQWLDHLLSEEPQKWITCSERLPEYEKYVLVTFIDKSAIDTKVMCVRRIEGFVDWYWSDFADEYTWEESEVVAWMPLPEPWGGDSDENSIQI